MNEQSDGRRQELAVGHEEQKGFARLAYMELRAKGIQRFRDEAGREYWLSDQKLQIILPDHSEVHYNIGSNTIQVMGPGETQFQGYEEYTGDFTPFVEAIGMAQTIGLSEAPSELGTVLNSVTTGQGETTAGVQGLLR